MEIVSISAFESSNIERWVIMEESRYDDDKTHDTNISPKVAAAPYQNIGFYLRECRKEKDYSLRYLASISGADYSTLSRIECGLIRPSVSTLRKLAPVLSLSFNELLARAGYSGQLPGDGDLYLDLEGNQINLFEVSLKMYRKDIFLFSSLNDFFDEYDSDRADVIKSLLILLKEEKKYVDKCTKDTQSSTSYLLAIIKNIKSLISTSRCFLKKTITN